MLGFKYSFWVKLWESIFGRRVSLSESTEALGPWKRRHQRRKVDALVKIKNADGKTYGCRNRDISAGGVFLVAHPKVMALNVGASVMMNIKFGSCPTIFKAEGRVARMTRETSVEAKMFKPGYGVEFTRVDTAGKKLFSMLLK
jgi:c-di-GMP-binding flagellar brake protein YcgR